MTNKRILGAEKNEIVTNDGYIVSKYFCNPFNVKKELNVLSGFKDGR